ncbi:MAG: hypothetical protein HY985_12130 [Magnetospirillum sp.]|nr:hypothetical protein [Magnetospirillum sp.]
MISDVKNDTFAFRTGLERRPPPRRSQATVDLLKLAPETEDRLNAGTQALETLKDGKKILRQQQKGFAKQKLEWIEKQIKLLKAMTADPKAIAKAVGSLARDLAAAVRSYAAAGSAANDPKDLAASPDVTATVEVVVAAKADVTVTTATAEGTTAAKPDHPATAAKASAVTAKVEVEVAVAAKVEVTAAPPDDEQAAKARAADAAAISADAAFLSEARAVARALKRLADRATNAGLPEEDRKKLVKDMKELDDAFAAASRAAAATAADSAAGADLNLVLGSGGSVAGTALDLVV